MKKNISINISGIIFHIEEDGYYDLKQYLESISKYFASYEDSHEIIADIESRIAEIFLAKLDDQKQIIVLEDVKALIDTMGTIADFEAIEEDVAEEEQKVEEPPEKEEKKEKKSNADDPGKRRLLRDEKRKVIGGVAAGMGYYLSIDPLWIRLIFVVLLLNLFIGTFSGIVFVIYVLLWIIVPGSNTLGEDEHVKKMFRDPESRVLGGVASGIAAFFGVDVTIIRLLFVLSVFLGGTGVVLYIIFWIITPEAKTITEKMQMQGEAVTLSNIQQTLKKSLTNEKGEESPLAKVLLFPFRVLSALFEALGNLLGPFSKVLVDVLRVFAGAVIGLTGFATMVALILLFGVILGVLPNLHEYVMLGHMPVHVLPYTFSPFAYMAIFVVVFVPFLFLALLGISIIAKRMVITAALGWPLFGIWVLSLISLAVVVPAAISSFAREGERKETRVFDVKQQPVTLRVNYLEGQMLDDKLLKIRGHEDSVFKAVSVYTAKGKSRAEAIENSKMIVYGIRHDDNELWFDSKFEYTEDAKFRAQEVMTTVYVPYGHVFKLDDDMSMLITNTFSRTNYWSWQIQEDNEWVFSEEGLKCLTCDEDESIIDRQKSLEYYPSGDSQKKSYGNDVMDFDLEGFDQIEVHGFYDVYIEQGDDYSVKIASSSRYSDDVVVKKYGELLEINTTTTDWKWLNDDKLKVFITLPDLKKFKSTGFCSVTIESLETDELSLIFSGATDGEVYLDVEDLNLTVDGGSKLEITGSVEYGNANVSGASSLNASNLNAESFELRATGASNAEVRVKDKLIVDAAGVSNVRYYGNPEVKINNEGGLSSIKRAN
jgi:phage shock protein PspC (stress-responsive transcriptional regulator)